MLVVDASQGVEAQTLANVYLAVNNNLTIVPVINKIDLPAADPENVRRQIEEVVGIDASEAILASAKEGKGIHEILEAVVGQGAAARGRCRQRRCACCCSTAGTTRYRGVVILVRVVDGVLRPKQKVRFMAARARVRDPDHGRVRAVRARDRPSWARARWASSPPPSRRCADARVGDTITDAGAPLRRGRCPASSRPSRWCSPGIFPTDSARYEDLRDALDKLRLNDASFTREPETSAALGFGFRCGFLGLLHMEIVQERLEREYNLDLITTAPTVRFRCVLRERRRHRARQPRQVPVRRRDRPDRGADHRRHHPHAAGVRGRHPQAVRGEARDADRA